jgi:hypothetical protein
MIIDTWETGQGGNADKNDTAAENSGNSWNLNGADPTVNRPFHEGNMVMMRLNDWQDYHGNACHIEGS